MLKLWIITMCKEVSFGYSISCVCVVHLQEVIAKQHLCGCRLQTHQELPSEACPGWAAAQGWCWDLVWGHRYEVWGCWT